MPVTHSHRHRHPRHWYHHLAGGRVLCLRLLGGEHLLGWTDNQRKLVAGGACPVLHGPLRGNCYGSAQDEEQTAREQGSAYCHDPTGGPPPIRHHHGPFPFSTWLPHGDAAD